MDKKSKKQESTPLNDLFVVVLIINFIGGVFTLIRDVTVAEGDALLLLSSILFTIIGLVGIYLILCLKKLGFWLLIIPKIIDIIVALMMTSNYDNTNAIILDIASITIILLLMLLRKNGKNAYQLLWNGYEHDIDRQ